MIWPQPQSFLEVLASGLVTLAAIFSLISFIPGIRTHATRLLAILVTAALALFANNPWTYFAAVFIIATAITELEFLQNLAAIVRGDKNWFDYRRSIQGQVAGSPSIEAGRTAMEYRILNTLWTKQVNKFPDLSNWFSFTIGGNQPDYQDFRQAGYKLLGEGLIWETDVRQFALTRKGFEFCRAHYKEFPADQWWPDEKIDEANLQRVLDEGANGTQRHAT